MKRTEAEKDTETPPFLPRPSPLAVSAGCARSAARSQTEVPLCEWSCSGGGGGEEEGGRGCV